MRKHQRAAHQVLAVILLVSEHRLRATKNQGTQLDQLARPQRPPQAGSSTGQPETLRHFQSLNKAASLRLLTIGRARAPHRLGAALRLAQKVVDRADQRRLMPYSRSSERGLTAVAVETSDSELLEAHDSYTATGDACRHQSLKAPVRFGRVSEDPILTSTVHCGGSESGHVDTPLRLLSCQKIWGGALWSQSRS